MAPLDASTGDAVRLALAAYRVAPTEANRDVLLSVDATARRERLDVSMAPETRFTKLDGGGLFATFQGYEYSTPLWDLRSHSLDRQRGTLTGRAEIVSADDRRAIVSTVRGPELQDISDPAHPRLLASLPSRVYTEHVLSANDAVDTITGAVVTDNYLNTVIKVWRYVGSSELREFVLPGDKLPMGLRVSPDGRTLAMSPADSPKVEIWRLDGDAPHRVAEMATQKSWVPTRFSPDGRFLLLVDSVQGQVQVWDVSDPAKPVVWAEVATKPRVEPLVAFSPDGRQLLLGTDRVVHIWDLAQRGEPVRVAAYENFPDNITAADHWTPPYGFIALTAGTIWLLRADVGEVVRNLCLGDPALSDGEWARYFPDVERVPVC